MERVIFVWDEIDDLLGTARRVLSMLWHDLLARRSAD
jgi:hypothetical protein